MVFPGLTRAGLMSRPHGLLTIWIGRTSDSILLACDSPDEFLDSLLENECMGSSPRRALIKGIVKRDLSAEFQLVSGSGEMLGEPIAVSADLVEGKILSRLVCEVEDRFLISEFDEH